MAGSTGSGPCLVHEPLSTGSRRPERFRRPGPTPPFTSSRRVLDVPGRPTLPRTDTGPWSVGNQVLAPDPGPGVSTTRTVVPDRGPEPSLPTDVWMTGVVYDPTGKRGPRGVARTRVEKEGNER